MTLDRERCIDLMEIVSKSCIDVFELRFGGVELIFDRRQISDSEDEKYLRGEGDFAVEVLSPVLGICRVAPSDGAPPYVQVGQAVCEYDIICSIDVLEKKFDVPAGARGIIVQLNIRSGELIEYKQQLAIIQAIR